MKFNINQSLLFVISLFLLSSQALGQGDLTTEEDIKRLPETPDTRDLDFLPPLFSLKMFAPDAGHQGKHATCVAWATTAARTICYAIRRGITHKDSLRKYSFSAGFLYYLIKKPNDPTCDSGSNIVTAAEALKKNGVPPRSIIDSPCIQSISDAALKAVLKAALPYRIDSFQQISLTQDADKALRKIKNHISKKRPVVITLRYYPSLWNTDSTGTWTDPPTEQYDTVKKPGHAMCIIGYDDEVNGGSFEVLNSYGTGWGRKGIFLLSYTQLRKHGLFAVAMINR